MKYLVTINHFLTSVCESTWMVSFVQSWEERGALVLKIQIKSQLLIFIKCNFIQTHQKIPTVIVLLAQ